MSQLDNQRSAPGTAPEKVTIWPESRRDWFALGAIVFIAAVVRFYGLGRDSLWSDEAASWWFASRPLQELWSEIPLYETNPPLYYSLLKLWSWLFGESEAALRGLSALASFLLVPLVYATGRLAVRGPDGRAVALLGAAIVALCPVQIVYAHEARAYALLCLSFAVLLVALLWLQRHPALLDRPVGMLFRDGTSGVRGAVVSVIVSAAASFWLHNTAVLLVGSVLGSAALLMWYQSGFSSQVLWNLVVIGAGILVIWIPDVPWLMGGVSAIREGFWISRPGPGDLLYGLDYVLGSMGMARTPGCRIAAAGLLMLAAGAGGVALWRRGQQIVALTLGSAVLVPLGMAIIASHLFTPIFMPRVLVWIELPFFVLLAASLLWMRWRYAQWGVAAATVLVLLTMAVSGSANLLKRPWREVARVLVEEATAADLIVLDSPYSQVLMQYYRIPERSQARWLPLPDAYPLPLGRNGYPVGFVVRDSIDTAKLAQIRDAAASHRKVWLVVRGQNRYDPNKQLPRMLESAHGPATVRVTSGSEAMLIEYGER